LSAYFKQSTRSYRFSPRKQCGECSLSNAKLLANCDCSSNSYNPGSNRHVIRSLYSRLFHLYFDTCIHQRLSGIWSLYFNSACLVCGRIHLNPSKFNSKNCISCHLFCFGCNYYRFLLLLQEKNRIGIKHRKNISSVCGWQLWSCLSSYFHVFGDGNIHSPLDSRSTGLLFTWNTNQFTTSISFLAFLNFKFYHGYRRITCFLSILGHSLPC